MTIEAIRFRVEGALVVLQVFEREKENQYSYGRDGTWRDAKPEDLLDVARFCSTGLDRRIEHLERNVHQLSYSQSAITQQP